MLKEIHSNWSRGLWTSGETSHSQRFVMFNVLSMRKRFSMPIGTHDIIN